MIRKLLYFVRSLFFKNIDFTEKSLNNGFKWILILAVLLITTVNYGQCNIFPLSATKTGDDIIFCIDSETSFDVATQSQKYVTVNVISGFTYEFSLPNTWGTGGGASSTEYIGLFNDANNAYITQSNGTGGTTLTWPATFSGKVKVLTLRGTACASGSTSNITLTVKQTGIGNNFDSQTAAGSNSWIGHIYNSPTISAAPISPYTTANYVGYLTTTKNFDTDFGGQQECTPVFSDGNQRALMYTEGMTIRYRMNSTQTPGCYLIKLIADDGVRLSIDNGSSYIVNKWIDQGTTTYASIMVNLTGNTNFVLDYYEKLEVNRISFEIIPFDASLNTITAPATVNFCGAGDPAVIDGSFQFNSADASEVNPYINFQWQRSVDGAAFSNINANGTGRTYDPPILPANSTSNDIVYQYRRLATSNVAGTGTSCDFTASTPVTIISSPASAAGTVSANQTICSGMQPGNITLTGSVGAIQWQVATALAGTYTNIVGATTNPLTSAQMGILTANRYYKAIVKSGTCTAATSTIVNVTVNSNPLPQGSLSANGPFCATGAGQLTFTSTAGAGPYTIVYNDGTANRTQTNVISGTAFATNPSPVTSTTTYTLVSVTGTACARTSGFTGPSASITVNPLPQGSLTANGPFCATGAGQLTFTSTAGAGPYTIVYNDGTANRTQTNVTSGTAFTPFTGTVTGTTTYTLVSVTGTLCARTSGFTGPSASITVNPLPQGSLTANGPFCATGAGQLTFTSTAGAGPYTIVYNDGTADRTQTNVTSGTVFTPFTGTVTGTTTYTLVSVTGTLCARTSGFTGPSASITVNPLPQGSLTANGPFCATGAGQLTFTSTAGAGPYTIVYNDGTANRTQTNVTSGTAFTPFTGTVTGTTTYTLVSVTGTLCARTSGFTGPSASITVNPLPQGSLTANGPFCATGAGQLTFTATAGTGPYTIVYNDGTADRTQTNVTSGTAFTPFTGTVTGTTTYTLVSVTGTLCARTSGFTGPSASITVNPLPQGSLTANGPFCATGAGQLTFTSTAGAGPYTIVYNDGTANRTQTNVTSGTAFTPFTGTVTGTTTYTLVSVTGTLCARTSGFTGPSASITVNPLPIIPTSDGVTHATCALTTGTIKLKDLPGSGKLFLSGPNSSTSYIIGAVTFEISSLAPGSYTFIVENANGCRSLSSAPIVIDAPGVKTWTGNLNTNYSDPGNWNPVTASSPSNTDCIVIPDLTSITNKPVLEGNGVVGNAYTINIVSNGSLVVNSNNTLKVVSTVTVAPATVTPAANEGILEFMNNASLVQTTDATNTGNIIYHRDINVRRYDFTYWSTPVVRTDPRSYKLSDLSPLTLLDKYNTYDAAGSKWQIFLNGAEEMKVAKGYTVRAPQPFDIVNAAPFTATFIGVPNNGPYPITPVPTKWNLIGNPYPSAIDADKFIDINHAASPSVDVGALYFWTHNTAAKVADPATGVKSYSTNDYAIYNLSGGASGGANPQPNGQIAATQSFFMLASGPDDIHFTNEMRIDGGNDQFYKPAKSKAIEKNRIWLDLTNAEGAFKQVLIGYIEGASNSWDVNYDAVTMNGNAYIDFYSINNANKLTIQGRALPFDDTDRVPLGYKTTIEGSFTIGIDHADGLFNGQAVYIEDKVTGTVQDLRTGNYAFTTAIGTFTDRFTLSYVKKTLGTGDFENLENSVFVSIKNKAIKVTSTKETINEVNIYDISGNVLYNKKKVGSNELQIPNLQSSNQVLLVKVNLENGFTTTKKIIFQ